MQHSANLPPQAYMRSLKEAYGVDVRIVEYYSENGNLQKVCSPQMTPDHWRKVRPSSENPDEW